MKGIFYKLMPILAIPILIVVGCKKANLEVKNPNDPKEVDIYSSGADVEKVAAGLFNTYFKGEHSASGIQAMLAVAADNTSCSWGNFAMRDMSWEPRDFGWNNAPSYSNSGYTKYTYEQMYATIIPASKVIKAIKNGTKLGEGEADNAKAIAVARYAQGLAYGMLALVYDRSFIVDEELTVDEAFESAVDYKQVAAAAIGYLEKAIQAANENFTIPGDWLGQASDITSETFKKICNTAAARILSYTPRNQKDLSTVDWNKVKAFADAGITEDFLIYQDSYTKWYFGAADYLVYNGWGVADMYVVNQMDPTQPNHWDNSADFPYPPKSTNPLDKRLETDFEYVPSNWFLAARGYYHFSTYRCKRYDEIFINADQPIAQFMLAENDMLKAEARMYSGDLDGAAQIINASTRKTRGEMPDVAANLEDLKKAIHHERHVEMYITGAGLQFFEMRKRNLLQKGTPLHLPLPAKLLETLRQPLPFYTFGTTSIADGINTSNGGWR